MYSRLEHFAAATTTQPAAAAAAADVCCIHSLYVCVCVTLYSGLCSHCSVINIRRFQMRFTVKKKPSEETPEKI